MTSTAARSLNEDSGFRSNFDLPQRRKLGMSGNIEGRYGARADVVGSNGGGICSVRRCGGGGSVKAAAL